MKAPAKSDAPAVRRILGLDLGTTSLRVHLGRLDGSSASPAEPTLISLPGSTHDGALPTVLRLGDGGRLQSYGHPALLDLPSASGVRLLYQFKPCIGQAPEDLGAQGRPERARFCVNPSCPHPGWAWSVAMQFCGFCGRRLDAEVQGDRCRPTFRYSQEEALSAVTLLLSQVSGRLQEQLGEPIGVDAGWRLAVGVPVHWQSTTLSRYGNAVAAAFPDVPIDLIQEPAAALRSHAFHRADDQTPRRTLLIDFGAGTTDLVAATVATCERQLEISDVRSYGEHFGGSDFDMLLAHYAAGEVGLRLDEHALIPWQAYAREWKEAFSAQIEQAGDGSAPVHFSFPVASADGTFRYRPVPLDRTRFEQVAGDLIERFRSVLERGLSFFGASPDQIERVVLTGGGAHWYFVQKLCRELFPTAVLLYGAEPERAVSRGLALSAALTPAGATSKRDPDPVAPPPFATARPAVLRLPLSLTPVEAALGCSKSGFVAGERRTFQIPAGVVHNQPITFPGQGLPGSEGEPAGDLILVVRLTETGPSLSPGTSASHPVPQRGIDLELPLDLTPNQARHGINVALDRDGQEIRVRVPAGTSQGQVIRVVGAGEPGRDGGPPGDLVLVARIGPASGPDRRAAGKAGHPPPANRSSK